MSTKNGRGSGGGAGMLCYYMAQYMTSGNNMLGRRRVPKAYRPLPELKAETERLQRIAEQEKQKLLECQRRLATIRARTK